MSTQVQISKPLVAVNALSGIVAKILNVGILIWLQQYLLGRISTEEYSLYPVLASLIIFLPLLTSVLTGGLTRFAIEAYARGDEHRVTQIASTMFVLLLGAGLVVLIGGLIFAWFVGDMLTIVPERLADARIMMSLMVAGFVLRTVLTPFLIGLEIRQKFVWLNLITFSTQLLRITILFLLLFGVSTRVMWVVVAAVSADICGLAATLILSRRLVPALTFRLRAINWGTSKGITSFGGWIFLAQLADTIHSSMDPIILNKLATARDVICFYLGSIAHRQVQEFSFAVRRPLLPPLTAMHAEGRQDRLRNAYVRGGRYALWGALFLAVPLIVYRQELMLLYVGEQYISAATVMGLLLLGFPLSYGNVMMFSIAQAVGQVRSWALRGISVHLVNLLLTLYFVGKLEMGAVGSALATFLVFAVGNPLLFWPLGRRLVGLPVGAWVKDTMWPGLMPGLAGAAAWLSLQTFVHPTGWFALAVCAVSGWLVYGIVLFRFSLRGPDRAELGAMGTKIKLWLSAKRPKELETDQR